MIGLAILIYDCIGFINVGCGDEVVPPVPPVTPVTPVDPVTPVTTVTNSRSETVTVIPIPTKDSCSTRRSY